MASTTRLPAPDSHAARVRIRCAGGRRGPVAARPARRPGDRRAGGGGVRGAGPLRARGAECLVGRGDGSAEPAAAAGCGVRLRRRGEHPVARRRPRGEHAAGRRRVLRVRRPRPAHRLEARVRRGSGGAQRAVGARPSGQLDGARSRIGRRRRLRRLGPQHAGAQRDERGRVRHGRGGCRARVPLRRPGGAPGRAAAGRSRRQRRHRDGASPAAHARPLRSPRADRRAVEGA